MFQIQRSLRQLLIDHLAATQPLLVDVQAGGDVLLVANASRFRYNDDVFVLSLTSGQADDSYPVITNIYPYTTPANLLSQFGIVSSVGGYPIRVSPALNSAWTVAESTSLQKAVNHQFLKRIYIGDFKEIPDFPAITISPSNEGNEWETLRATGHEYRFSIKSFVLADNFEEAEETLIKLTENIREILIEHIHPIIDGVSVPLTADLPANSIVATVADSSQFRVGGIVFIRSADVRPEQPLDPYQLIKLRPIAQEDIVRTILSPTQIELVNPAHFDYFASRQSELVKINRYIYDSRPENIEYNYAPGTNGSFLRASEITWFAKEQIFREGNIPS